MNAADNNGSTRIVRADQRENHLLGMLRANGRIEACDMATELGVTGETIRKDLIHLERRGLLRRVHAGAVASSHLSAEPAIHTGTDFAQQKSDIARAARKHIPVSGTVLIDAGSTTAALVEVFPGDRALTVYTNTLTMALSLSAWPTLAVFSLGGRVQSATFAEVDDWGARALAEISVDVAFLGAGGISLARGLTTPDPAEAAVKRRMLNCARKRIILADHSKIDRVRGIQFGNIHDVDLLITDSGLEAAQLDELRAAGMTVERA